MNLYPVPLPAPEDRASILRAVCRSVAIDQDSVDIEVRGVGRDAGYRFTCGLNGSID